MFSLNYATILPALFEWNDLLGTFPYWTQTFSDGPRLPAIPALLWWIVGLVAYVVYAIDPLNLIGAGTALLAPMITFAAAVSLVGIKNPWSLLPQGNWEPLLRMMVATMANAFFWEMWNIGSINSAPSPVNTPNVWLYELQYVNVFFFFEVPGVAFISYFLFGITCLTQYLFFAGFFGCNTTSTGRFLLYGYNFLVLSNAIFTAATGRPYYDGAALFGFMQAPKLKL